jgi:hypothetical protein
MQGRRTSDRTNARKETSGPDSNTDLEHLEGKGIPQDEVLLGAHGANVGLEGRVAAARPLAAGEHVRQQRPEQLQIVVQQLRGSGHGKERERPLRHCERGQTRPHTTAEG